MFTIAVAACIGVGVGLLARASVTPGTLLYGVAPATSTSSTTLGSSTVPLARSARLGSQPGVHVGPSRRSFADGGIYEPQTLEQDPMTLGAGLSSFTLAFFGAVLTSAAVFVRQFVLNERPERFPLNQLALDVQTAGSNDFDVIAIMAASGEKGEVMLEVKDLCAVVADTGKEILKGFNLIVREGEVHAIMGKNGSGKSTLTKVLVGHPAYKVTSGSVTYRGQNLLKMEPEERAHAGLFLSFQAPIEIPGVSNTDFMRMSYNAKRKAKGEPELDPLEFYSYLMPKLRQLNMDPSFLGRNVNEGFSGGEKKRNEILQLAVLEAEMALLDEIDSGLDVDALRDVAAAVNGLKRPNAGLLMITHYKRLLDLIEPDIIHIVQDGKVIKTGDKSLSSILEDEGFTAFQKA